MPVPSRVIDVVERSIDVIDIRNYLLMVKFEVAKDQDKVTSGAHWMIFHNYLAIQSWVSDYHMFRFIKSWFGFIFQAHVWNIMMRVCYWHYP